MYSTFVATGVDQRFFADEGQKSILSIKDDLVVFCPAEKISELESLRRVYDSDLTKTLIVPYNVGNLDSWHLYNQQLQAVSSDNNAQFESDLLKHNRMAFVRDYFAKNYFKKSHVLWIDYDSPVLSHVNFETKLFENLSLCKEAQVAFRDDNQVFEASLFILPQEMGWNFYYLNKLIHKDFLYTGQHKTYADYFATFLERHPEQFDVHEKTIQQIAETLQSNVGETLPPKFETDKKLVVVVNHFQQDTSWVNRLYHPAVVYNKNPNDFDKYELNLPNVGFDTIVYFRYIIDNYDNLPDYMCFLQDDPFFHCMDVIQIVNNFKFDRDFVPMSTSYYLGGHDWKMSEDYAARVGLQFQRPLKMITSCQVIISREKVLQRPKEFYELLVSTIDMHVKSSENYAIENLWPTILGFNEELVPCMNCKGYGDKQ